MSSYPSRLSWSTPNLDPSDLHRHARTSGGHNRLPGRETGWGFWSYPFPKRFGQFGRDALFWSASSFSFREKSGLFFSRLGWRVLSYMTCKRVCRFLPSPCSFWRILLKFLLAVWSVSYFLKGKPRLDSLGALAKYSFCTVFLASLIVSSIGSLGLSGRLLAQLAI